MNFSNAAFSTVLLLASTACNGTSTPSFVQSLAKQDFPADSKIHILNLGTFKIKPDTIFCTLRETTFPLNGSQVRNALAMLKQSEHWQGMSRINALAGGKECGDRSAIFVYGRIEPNRRGMPYRVTLEVWQGQAAWIGRIERLNGRAPGISGMADENGHPVGPSEAGLSAMADADRLSYTFTKFLTKKGGL
ncbi:hypothetical protein WG908_16250 [Sphingobium sp. AN641]|uniref:hypothetical protein n=1 Tax=Sphingobium sp. AN641 TaxID=3133443 RepID=UPI0030BD3BCB